MAAHKLTVLKIKSLTKPGRYGDGGGLWLQVRAPSKPTDDLQANKSWLFRYTQGGKARQMGLGSVDDVSLAEARAKAALHRKTLVDGGDPIDQRAEERAAKLAAEKPKTFKQAAESYLNNHESAWRHPKHRAQWRGSMDLHAYPILGALPVHKVATDEVMKVLEPIWVTKPETASRVRQRIETVLDYAKARGWRTGENPARLRGHIASMLPKRNRSRSTVHYPALAWKEASAFMSAVQTEPGTAALALQFTILTAARTNETIGAVWSEINLQDKIWTVPKGKMKGGKEHRVPLSKPALAILAKAEKLRTDVSGTAFVFPGNRAGKPLSNMAMAMLLRRMKRSDLTVHGFRSTFRDWVGESTNYPREIAEAALAHAVENRVEAAYKRGDFFEKRVRLMAEWAKFCERPAVKGEVVSIGVARAS